MSGKIKVKGNVNININEATDNAIVQVRNSTDMNQGSFFFWTLQVLITLKNFFLGPIKDKINSNISVGKNLRNRGNYASGSGIIEKIGLDIILTVLCIHNPKKKFS